MSQGAPRGTGAGTRRPAPARRRGAGNRPRCGGTPWVRGVPRRASPEARGGNPPPVSRRSVAEALVTVTIALSTKEPGAPDPKVLRQALFGWAFNPATRD